MAAGAVFLFGNGKRPLAAVAGAAGFPFPHLGHGYGFIFPNGHIGDGVALLTGQPQISRVEIMAEGYGLGFGRRKEDIPAPDSSQSKGGKQKDRAKE